MNLNRVVIVPCFNVHLFCKKVLEEMIPFVDDLIVIDDGSTDGTGLILQEMALNYASIHLITFPQNRGKGFALIEGFAYANKHLEFFEILTIDSDGQHNPADIPAMIQKMGEGVDMVIGTRQFSKMPFRSRIANTLVLWFLRWFYREAPYDTQSGFRAFTKEFSKEISANVKGGRYETEFSCLLLALQEKKKIAKHDISTIYIENNRYSNFSVVRDSFRILKVLFQHVIKRGWHDRFSKSSFFRAQ